MLTILEDIRAEAEKLWQAGVHEAESIMKKAEEAISWHKGATEEPANDAEGVHVIPGIEVTEITSISEAPAADAFPGEPALSASPEGVLVEGAGIVSQAHIDAVRAEAAPSTDPAPAAPGA